MRCEQARQQFLQLDNQQPIPPQLQLHLESCPACREKITTLQNLFTSWQHQSAFDMKQDPSEEIMRHLQPMAPAESLPRISLGKWIAVGSFILMSILIIPNSEALVWLNQSCGRDLQIFLYLSMGCIISSYIVLCIGIHLDEAKELVNYAQRHRS